jgi:SAM-dependent methyltransferase
VPFEAGRFRAATCFTMLHHVPSPALQDKLLAEMARVLRRGAVLLGVDSLDSPAWRNLHEGAVCVPIDPLGLAERLRQAGFSDVKVTVWSIGTRFGARIAA